MQLGPDGVYAELTETDFEWPQVMFIRDLFAGCRSSFVTKQTGGIVSPLGHAGSV